MTHPVALVMTEEGYSGFDVATQGKHIVMTDGRRNCDHPKARPRGRYDNGRYRPGCRPYTAEIPRTSLKLRKSWRRCCRLRRWVAGGEILVLDMGDPVRIVDLARNLILLSGLRPDEDIRIEFTGMRPGEKLYEELNLADEDILPTRHEKIRIFAGSVLPAVGIRDRLEDLRYICGRRDVSGLVLALKDLVPD